MMGPETQDPLGRAITGKSVAEQCFFR